MRVSVRLGDRCAAIAEYQLERSSFFIVESLVGPELYQKGRRSGLKRRCDLAVGKFHLCMAGRVGRGTGLPPEARGD
eukprot:3080433-Pyramimonas_sp.AAC.1